MKSMLTNLTFEALFDLGFGLFVYFFLLLYLLNNRQNIKLKWVDAAKGGGEGGGRTTKKEVNLLPCKIN